MAKTKKSRKSTKVPVIQQKLKEVLTKVKTKKKGQIKNPHQILINEVHNLNQELGKIKSIKEKNKELIERKKQIEKKLDELGGLSVYQKASKMGEREFNSSKYLMVKYAEKFKTMSKLKNQPLKLLDIGALDLNYEKYKFIDAKAIDLHPNVAGVTKMDFLEMPYEQFDIICLALVLNFNGDPKQRGQMLKKAYTMLNSNINEPTNGETNTNQNSIKKGGILYIVLPKQCIKNSRFMNKEIMISLTLSIGFELLDYKETPKLVYFIFRKVEYTTQVFNNSMRDSFNLHQGGGANSFDIVI